MSETYYIRIRGKVSGPHDLDQLKEMKARGQLSPIHEASTDKVSWWPARRLEEIFGGQVSLNENNLAVELLPEEPHMGQLEEDVLIQLAELEPAKKETPSQVVRSLTTTDKAGAIPVAEASPENRFLKMLLIVSGCILVLVVGTILIIHQISASKTNIQLAELTAVVDKVIHEAQQSVADQRFDLAQQHLKRAEDMITKSPLSRAYTLLERVQQESAQLKVAEKDYNDKIAKGWVLFEGTFMSPEEKGRLLADRRRQEEEQQRQEEARRLAEEKRREEENLLLAAQRERERLNQVEQSKVAAYVMSQEFIKDTLHSPDSAVFPDYIDSAVIVVYDSTSRKYTVKAWVQAKTPSGNYLRKNYICTLWPVEGNKWKSSLATLLDE